MVLKKRKLIYLSNHYMSHYSFALQKQTKQFLTVIFENITNRILSNIHVNIQYNKLYLRIISWRISINNY